MNSAKSSDVMSPRGALAVQGMNPLQKIPRGPHARPAVRAHDQPDRYLELLRARTSSTSLSASSRSPASSTDEHQRRQRVCHHRCRYRPCRRPPQHRRRCAIFIIVADGADVILSPRMLDYRHRAHLHHRFRWTITAIGDAIIVGVIVGAAVPRIMRFCQTSCGWEGAMFARAFGTTTSSSSK